MIATTEKPKILLAEDDSNLGWLLKESLENKGYDIELAKDGEDALEKYQDSVYDIGVFDVMMPKMDGFTLAKEIRKVDNEIPLIFLTAKSMKEDRIEGFKIGGDDYVTKPFSIEELELRIQAILKRTKGEEEEDDGMYEIGSFKFDFNHQTLKNDELEQRLTTKENQLLRLLCKNKNGILEREIALKKIWGNDNYFTARSMDVFITKLRKYLKSDSEVEIINVHGTGYKLLAS